MSGSYVVAPSGWSRSEATGLGPFVTHERFHAPDGTVVEWTSRDHRKQAGCLDARRGSTWWAPTAVGWCFWTWEPARIDWSASSVQLVGTVFFNVTTLAAIDTSLNATQAHRLVWVPDVVGSICFLAASGLAWFEVSHGWWSWHTRSISWRVAALNFAGSIAFGVSAVASKVVSTTGEPRNITLVNLGTAVGGLCFFVGALLLFPERTARRPVTTASSSTRS